MKVSLDSRKSLRANAAHYFEQSKEMRAKQVRIKSAILEVEGRIAQLSAKSDAEQDAATKSVSIRTVEKKEWFERFHWFTTSSGFLCIAGKDAKQNELLVGKYFEQGDLFFHADVQGAAVTILKNGDKDEQQGEGNGEQGEGGDTRPGAAQQDLAEVAQFAASFSKAWKGGFTSVDVYAVGREQVSKSAQSGEYLAKGAFVIRGERKWFRNTELKLVVGKSESGKLSVLPANFEVKDKGSRGFVEVVPGVEKALAAKEVAGKLKLDAHEKEVLLQLLP